MCTFSTKKIETHTRAIWDTGSYNFVFVPDPSGQSSKIPYHFETQAVCEVFFVWISDGIWYYGSGWLLAGCKLLCCFFFGIIYVPMYSTCLPMYLRAFVIIYNNSSLYSLLNYLRRSSNLLTYLLTYELTNVLTYVPTYQCTYVPTYLCMYIPTYLRTYIPMYLCTYLPMYLCTYVPMYPCTYIPMYLRTYVPILSTYILWYYLDTCV
jgi:hypothetical protein